MIPSRRPRRHIALKEITMCLSKINDDDDDKNNNNNNNRNSNNNNNNNTNSNFRLNCFNYSIPKECFLFQ